PPVTTEGDVGVGILAQSIGGGGGAGGHADSIFLTGSSKKPVNDSGAGFSLAHLKSLELALGGNGGDGGNGGTVKVTHHYQPLTTYGDSAAAILAQSIGGGGGVAAAADHVTFLKTGRIGGKQTIGNGSTVSVATASDISTSGLFASGIIAQSLGGGGGAVLSSENLRGQFLKSNDLNTRKGDVVVGGFLSAGKGGRVTVKSGGNISTSGNFAAGVIAQSIGGGGGLATIDNADSATYVTLASELDTSSSSHNGADQVSISQSGSITTSGIGAIGIVAQSIGGGGGLVQAATAIIDETANAHRDAGLNKHDGGGSGGKVAVTQTADSLIRTTGDGAVGILAQSTGGTGGFIQKSDGKLSVHNHNTAGTGGDVTIVQNGILSTEGNFADGIHVITHGSETPGNIDITANGTIQTLGSDVNAIVAAAAGDKSGDITITIGKGGRVLSMGGRGDAVVIDDTTTGLRTMARISNSGLISSSDGFAIRSNQFVHITNEGTISGDIDVTADREYLLPLPSPLPPAKVSGTSAGYLSNASAGTLQSGDSINLGTYRSNETFYGVHLGLLDNAGTLSPGGAAEILNTQLSGRYESSDTAIYAVDLNLDLGTSDHLRASHGAVVEGVIAPHILSFGSQSQVQILSTPKTADLSFSAKAAEMPVVMYSVSQAQSSAGDHVVNLTVENIDFEADGLGSNEAAVARTLNARLASGIADTDADLLALANATTLGELSHLLGSYSDAHSAKQAASLRSGATHFTGSVFSCGVANGAYAAIAETECDWSEAGYRWTEHQASSNSVARDERLFNLSVGAQRELSENWRLGIAAGYGILDSISYLAASEAKLAQAGMVAKYQKGNLLLGGSITVGHSWQDMVRAIPLSPGVQAVSSTQSSWIHGRLRAGYLFEIEDWFAKPLADMDFNYTHTNGYTETGAGSYNLSVLPADDFQMSVAVGMEFGRSFALSPRLSVRTYGYGGVRYTPDNTTTTQVRFSGIASPVTQVFEHDRYLGEISAGLKFFGQEGLGLDVRYDGAFGKSITSQSIKGKIRWRF
ncbi:MAG: autotransporter outer membrane beta-barrel domain-containing protein, partial [Hoeflea sp.]|uniref:autotransporter outer membrane beta-barrel domain-containing protein n=1 Tax=Hoeflea sp. TaxID=1940281 RepID=UPI003297C409